MAIRVLMSVILLFSVLFLPFYISVALALIGMVFFAFFIEAVFILFLSDLLFASGAGRGFGGVFSSLVWALIALFIIEFLRKKIRIFPGNQIQ